MERIVKLLWPCEFERQKAIRKEYKLPNIIIIIIIFFLKFQVIGFCYYIIKKDQCYRLYTLLL